MFKIKAFFKFLLNNMWIVGGVLLLILGVVLGSSSTRKSGAKVLKEAKTKAKESAKELKTSKKSFEKIKTTTEEIVSQGSTGIKEREEKAHVMIKPKGVSDD